MRILITGAASTVGIKLIDKLLSQNVEVLALYNKTKPKENVYCLQGNIEKKESLKMLEPKIGSLDAIIHLAAYVPKTQNEDLISPSVQTNIVGTGNILEVFGKKAKRIIYISTTEIYGLDNRGEKIKESFVPNPLSYYAISKLVGEKYCQAFAQKNNVSLSILRLASMYGYKDSIQRAIPNFITACLTKTSPIVYGGDELRDYIHIEDAVQAIFLSTISENDGVFNIGSGKGIHIKQVAEIIKNHIDPSLAIIVKKRQKRLADLVLNIDNAKTKLGYKPNYIFPDGLDETINLYRGK